MVAKPDAFDRRVEAEMRSLDLRTGLGMGISASDKDVVEATAMIRLPHNLFGARPRMRVINRPSEAGSFAGNGPL